MAEKLSLNPGKTLNPVRTYRLEMVDGEEKTILEIPHNLRIIYEVKERFKDKRRHLEDPYVYAGMVAYTHEFLRNPDGKWAQMDPTEFFDCIADIEPVVFVADGSELMDPKAFTTYSQSSALARAVFLSMKSLICDWITLCFSRRSWKTWFQQKTMKSNKRTKISGQG